MRIPLPAVSTLAAFFRHFEVTEGFLDAVATLIKVKVRNMTPRQRITCLAMDELHLRSDIEYDRRHDQVVGPHTTANVLFARGLFAPWKVPVFYQYKAKLTKTWLMDIVKRLQECGLQVVSLVADQGPNNLGLARDLGVTTEKSHFSHPVSGEEIFFFHDIPHLLKSLRNNFMDYGFVLPTGETITPAPLFKLLDKLSDCEYKTSYKLKRAHLHAKGADRQRVHLASELFSQSVAIDLEQQFPRDVEALALAEFIRKTDNWFDVMNSRMLRDPKGKKMRAGFRVNLQIQRECIIDFQNLIRDMRVQDHGALMKWQKGILISIQSVLGLYDKLSANNGIEFILTHRLNQDCLESAFSTIRQFGGTFQTPGALDFQRRLRNYILRGSIDLAVETAPVNIQQQDEILTAGLERSLVGDTVEKEDMESEAEEKKSSSDALLCEVQDCRLPPPTENVDKPFGSRIESEGFLYVCGYVSLAGGDPTLFRRAGDTSKNKRDFVRSAWIDEKNNGGLVFPSKTLVQDLLKMEEEFQFFHLNSTDGLSREPGVVEGLTNLLVNKFPLYKREMLHKFVMTRTAIQMRNIRERLRVQAKSARGRTKPIEYDY